MLEGQNTKGRVRFDNVVLEDLTDPSRKRLLPGGDFEDIARYGDDTALPPDAVWREYAGGGGTVPRSVARPWVGGEYSPATADQKLEEDPTGDGTWLHKAIWSSLSSPGVPYQFLWYTNALLKHRLYQSQEAARAFVAGLPLSNGRWRDADPDCTGGLRAWGQKDLPAGRAYLWIDNPEDAWAFRRAGKKALAKTGVVSLAMKPGAAYTAEWWDTRKGKPVRVQAVKANADGDVVLRVDQLATDTAVKLSPAATGQSK